MREDNELIRFVEPVLRFCLARVSSRSDAEDLAGEIMLHALEERGVYVSSGSACSSNKHSVSSTLKSIGLPQEKLESTLRFSFSPENTMDQVDYAVDCCKELLPVLRRYRRKK